MRCSPDQRGALLCHHEEPGRIPVQAMRKLQELGLGPGGAQRLDEPRS